MKTFILLGEAAVTLFQHADWSLLEKAILEQNRGDIISWNKETDSVDTLLDMLSGWNNFIKLSEQDLKDIEANTKIEIDW